ncbi:MULTISPECIES: Tad domain-containing protein [Pasteurellaceae]|uniref:Tight adherence protein G n=1 Tax=Pasteurella atlantica TaxID=2827233 RepID=A0AAW8CPR1_9PAST|nr:Tad domain-containing protein [Pasteurella atlantica]MBR0573536.1 pilus assembly protein [Pasteurella atlantica]MDP8039605.1 hypothetical protein [Pasteurella atlantica]MDP8041696.1 hypothetical protein [Pasteurella atlantica]MDP8043831.1 hypothetical protein [Pasteurella atlantica]MDP8045917.1 hypothetical protein [Pasteurella atlantica]
MDNIKKKYQSCRDVFSQFLKNEQGVYTIVMSLMSFALLGFIALVVDGSGILLDKARFTQGMEQASLLLIAENNKDRPTIHIGVTRQSITKQELDAFNKDTLKAQQDKRNKEMIATMVRSYYQGKSYKPDNYTITDQYTYRCGRLKYSVSVVCEVDGNFDRPSWVYLGKEFGLTFAKTVNIKADTLYAVKQRNIAPPVDLMLITDLSGSMGYSLSGGGPTKLSVLKEVFSEVSEELLSSNNKQNIHNRIGFTSFSLGVQQQNNLSQCVFPYRLLSSASSTQYKIRNVLKKRTEWWELRHDQNVWINNNFNYQYNLSDKDELLDAIFRIIHSKYTGVNISKFIKVESNKSDDQTNYIESFDAVLEQISRTLNNIVDYPSTIRMIDNFNGKDIEGFLSFEKNGICLKQLSNSITTTKTWYNYQESNDFKQDSNRLSASGSTLSSSGFLIGANLMMNKNLNALPEKVISNTQRVIIMLSDGVDELTPKSQPLEVTQTLITNHKMCEHIRNRIDSLQDNNYPIYKTKIGFVAFGYDKNQKGRDEVIAQQRAWKECVGEGNFYEANNKKELLEAFKSVAGITEEVGRTINSIPNL